MMKTMQQKQDELNSAFANLKTMREAMGVETVVGPNAVETYSNQVDIVQDEQGDSE